MRSPSPPPPVHKGPLMQANLRTSWVETRNLSLEELDALFDGQKHSDVPDVDTVLKAKMARSDVEVLHGQPVLIDETTVIVGAKE